MHLIKIFIFVTSLLKIIIPFSARRSLEKRFFFRALLTSLTTRQSSFHSFINNFDILFRVTNFLHQKILGGSFPSYVIGQTKSSSGKMINYVFVFYISDLFLITKKLYKRTKTEFHVWNIGIY